MQVHRSYECLYQLCSGGGKLKIAPTTFWWNSTTFWYKENWLLRYSGFETQIGSKPFAGISPQLLDKKISCALACADQTLKSCLYLPANQMVLWNHHIHIPRQFCRQCSVRTCSTARRRRSALRTSTWRRMSSAWFREESPTLCNLMCFRGDLIIIFCTYF